LTLSEKSDSLSQEFDVVCLGGGVAGEAIVVGLEDSRLTLAVVERAGKTPDAASQAGRLNVETARR
jgi:2-polyprenyl-6-methoxyphenol hydroxylase-like FAD-dependent oxidoreductase